MSDESLRDRSSFGSSLVGAARGARPGHLERARLRAGVDARIAAATVAAAATATAMQTGAAAGKTTGSAVVGAASLTTIAGGTVAGGTVAGGTVAGGTAVIGGASLWLKIGLASAILAAGSASTWWLAGRSTTGDGGDRTGEQVAVAPPSPIVEVAPTPSASAPEVVDTAEPAAPSSTPSADVAPGPLATSGRPVGSSAASSPPGRDAASIANEVALLRQAQAAMKDGDPERSLAALDALAKKHPGGELREERQAARVLSLCAAGRTDEARAEGRRFLASNPKSVHAERVRASCAFAPAAARSVP